VVLNAERRAEESTGHVRLLWPEYQEFNAIPINRMLEGFVEYALVATARRKQHSPNSHQNRVRTIKEILRGSPAQTAQLTLLVWKRFWPLLWLLAKHEPLDSSIHFGFFRLKRSRLTYKGVLYLLSWPS
jgi:hypothetical protein